ncbi:hypothetical protein DV515_00020014, partial [Chloebia gouldiae]
WDFGVPQEGFGIFGVPQVSPTPQVRLSPAQVYPSPSGASLTCPGEFSVLFFWDFWYPRWDFGVPQVGFGIFGVSQVYPTPQVRLSPAQVSPTPQVRLSPAQVSLGHSR